MQNLSIRTVADPVVAVHDTHAGAEATIRELGRAGFDLKKLSIIGKGLHAEEHPIGFYTSGDRIKQWAAAGSIWGAIWGLLLGPAIFVVPAIGVIVAAGPIGVALIAALEGAALVGSVSAVVGALISIGVSKEAAIRYEADVKADRFVVLVHGTNEDVEKARAIVQRRLAEVAIQQAA